MGVGGLHSTNNSIKSSEKLGYFGSQMIFAQSGTTHSILNLDFQSFYVNLILQLLNKTKTNSLESQILNRLNDQRLEMKKNKDPRDQVLKIATLAYTGSLNYYKSEVYDPQLYYSMTINGQLVCLQLIHKLLPYVEHIIDINTDGFILYINNDYYDVIMELCDDFEKLYQFKIDTRETLKSGFFYSSNKKIFINQDGKETVKGFQTKLSFNIESNLLVNLLKNGTQFLNTNNVIGTSEFYNCLWKFFNKEISDIFSSKNVEPLLNHFTFNGNKVLIYFSKTPTNLGGLPGNRWGFYPYPIKVINFENYIKDKNTLIQNIILDIDVASYWSYILNKFEKHYFFNLKQNVSVLKPITFNNCFIDWSKKCGIDYSLFYKKNKYILRVFNCLIEKRFYLFLKDRDKKSFPKTKMVQSNLSALYNTNNHNHVYKQFFKNYPFGFERGVTLAANLGDCFNNGICCLDFDGVEWFFKENNFNELENERVKNFVIFILKIKNTGFFVSSSMTNTPFDRFKVFFKLINKPKSVTYKAFKSHQREEFDFSIEDLASIVGPNNLGQNLIPSGGFKHLLEIDYFEYINFFNKKSSSLINDNKKSNKYFTLVFDLFEPRSYDQRSLYNNLLENELKNEQLNFFYFNKYPIQKKVFEELFAKVINKNNFNNLKTIAQMFEFYNFSYNSVPKPSLDSEGLEKPISNKKLIKKNTGIKIEKKEVNEILHINSSHITAYNKCKMDNYSLPIESIDSALTVIDYVINHINRIYNTNFVFTQQDECTFIYHSRCIFDLEPVNDKQVTLYINKFLFCNITCYHNKCKEYNKYKEIANVLNKNFYCFIVSNPFNQFTPFDGSVENIYNTHTLNP